MQCAVLLNSDHRKWRFVRSHIVQQMIALNCSTGLQKKQNSNGQKQSRNLRNGNSEPGEMMMTPKRYVLHLRLCCVESGSRLHRKWSRDRLLRPVSSLPQWCEPVWVFLSCGFMVNYWLYKRSVKADPSTLSIIPILYHQHLYRSVVEYWIVQYFLAVRNYLNTILSMISSLYWITKRRTYTSYKTNIIIK